MDPRELLLATFTQGVAAVHPDRVVPGRLPAPPRGRTLVVGAGKAAAAMAHAFEAGVESDRRWRPALRARPPQGLVVTRYGHGAPTRWIEVVEAAHPVPDAAGREAARRILERVQAMGEGDLVVCLLSGGASALLTLPAPGITLEDKQAVNRALLASGAPIGEMNVVRKHLSAIKGGRLAAAAAPAACHTLAISDVPGDDPATIGSGPTVGDTSTREEALAILRRYRIEVPERVLAWLARPESETPKPGDPRLARASVDIVARAQDALEAAADVARADGVTPVILGDAIEGEAREVARVLAGIARQVARWEQPAPAPALLISGGETTVTVRGDGRGGRNAELLLALAIALDGHPRVHAFAGDTDGIDGTEDNAGALVDPGSLARARALGLDPRSLLERNDGYRFFSALGDLVVTGPTRTNVNDLRSILVTA